MSNNTDSSSSISDLSSEVRITAALKIIQELTPEEALVVEKEIAKKTAPLKMTAREREAEEMMKNHSGAVGDGFYC